MERNRKGEVLIPRRWVVGAFAGFVLYNKRTRNAFFDALMEDGDTKKDQSTVPHPNDVSYSAGDQLSYSNYRAITDKYPINLGKFDNWSVRPDYEAVLQGLNIGDGKRDFVRFAILGVNTAMARGATVNPRVMVAQAVLETFYGQDSGAAIGNFFGIKSSGPNSVSLDTHEDLGGDVGKVPMPQNFTGYQTGEDHIFDSFYDYSRLIMTKGCYADAVACRYDDKKYLLGLENVIDADGDVIGKQGGTYNGVSVKSYATDRHYVDSILNVVDYLNLDQIFALSD